jgi:hypothetical protein
MVFCHRHGSCSDSVAGQALPAGSSEIAAHVETTVSAAEVAPISARVASGVLVGTMVVIVDIVVTGIVGGLVVVPSLGGLRAAGSQQGANSAAEQDATGNAKRGLHRTSKETAPAEASLETGAVLGIVLAIPRTPLGHLMALSVASLLLQFLDAALRHFKCVLLNENCLRHVVGGCRLTGDLSLDKVHGVAVAIGSFLFGGGKPIEQTFDGAAVFGVQHFGSPNVERRTITWGPMCSLTMGLIGKIGHAYGAATEREIIH